MTKTRILALGLGLFVILVVAPTASPVQLSYVYSDSMEPTISEGSGYILVPAGDIQRGDIITFHAESRDEYVTHRVVAITEEGIITKGDNNPSTDQETGLPPVDRSQVIGQVLVVAGDPITIPHLEAMATWIQAYWPLLIGGSFIYLLFGSQNTSKRPRRTALLARDIFHPLFAGIILMGIVYIVLSASHTSTVYVATAGGISGANTLTVGETVTRNYTVHLTKTPLTQTVVTTDGMDVLSRQTTTTETQFYGMIVHRSVNMTFSIQAPSSPGPKRTAIYVYSYPRTLPHETVRSLTKIHPILGGLGTILAGLAPLFGSYLVFVNPNHPVRLPRSKWIRRYFEKNA